MACFHVPLPLGGVVAKVGVLGVREQTEHRQVLSLQSELIIFFFFSFWLCCVACKISNPRPGIKPWLDWGQESQASSWVEAWNSACLSRCPRGERPLAKSSEFCFLDHCSSGPFLSILITTCLRLLSTGRQNDLHASISSFLTTLLVHEDYIIFP